MIIRIVKMQFQEDKTDQFLEIFKESNKLIRHFKGCLQLKLVRDIHSKNVFFTISHWTSESDLEHYRKSDLFQETWKKTKTLFHKRAEAYSTSECHFENYNKRL